jgi:hypothetical protein
VAWCGVVFLTDINTTPGFLFCFRLTWVVAILFTTNNKFSYRKDKEQGVKEVF